MKFKVIYLFFIGLLAFTDTLYSQDFICRGGVKTLTMQSTNGSANRFRWVLFKDGLDISGPNNNSNSTSIRLTSPTDSWGSIVSGSSNNSASIQVGSSVIKGSYVIRGERLRQPFIGAPSVLSTEFFIISVNVIPSPAIPTPQLSNVAPNCSCINFTATNPQGNFGINYAWSNNGTVQQSSSSNTVCLFPSPPLSGPQIGSVQCTAPSCPNTDPITTTLPGLPNTTWIFSLSVNPTQVCLGNGSVVTATITSNKCLLQPIQWNLQGFTQVGNTQQFGPGSFQATFQPITTFSGSIGATIINFRGDVEILPNQFISILNPNDPNCQLLQVKRNNDNGKVKNSDILIYPNPTSGIAVFDNLEGVENLQVLDINGKVILNTVLDKESPSYRFDTMKETNGLYIIRFVRTDKTIETKRLVVNH
jgi:hypothetical protein